VNKKGCIAAEIDDCLLEQADYFVTQGWLVFQSSGNSSSQIAVLWRGSGRQQNKHFDGS
jgi:hypothetical protein